MLYHLLVLMFVPLPTEQRDLQTELSSRGRACWGSSCSEACWSLMLLGVPIVFSIGIAAVLGTFVIGDAAPWIIIPSSMINGMDSFPLMAVPFFILAGELMNRGGIAERLVNFANSLVGHVHGGLGHATVVSNTMLSLDTGSALAQVAAIGRIMIPPMERRGYSREFATALACSSALLGPIIPPSIIMVIYSVAAGASVGQLFLAGIVPGILVAVSLMIYVYVRARMRGDRPAQRFSGKQVLITGKDAMLALLMPVIILGGIFAGIMTPTESAAVAVLYAVFAGACRVPRADAGAISTNACSTPGSSPASSC